MCCCWSWDCPEESMNRKLNSKLVNERLRFFEKLDLWLFFHTHPNFYNTKYNQKEKDILPPKEDFVINPMRESVEVIVGGFDENIFY